jgi:hypothetical protein
METLPLFPCYVGETNELWRHRFRQKGKSMKFQQCLEFGLLFALASCGPQRQPEQAANNAASPVLPAPSAPPAVLNKAVPTAQPQGQAKVDPKSTQAAVGLVKTFADLLNQRKFDQAYMLLGPAAPSRPEFDRRFSQYSDLNVVAGSSGEQEGAAGSIYVSVPLTITGSMGGKHTSRSATALVRRINDVPGSTEAQRRWHIERIDWEDAD